MGKAVPICYTQPLLRSTPASVYSYHSVVIPHAAAHGAADIPHTCTYLSAVSPIPIPTQTHSQDFKTPGYKGQVILQN